MIRPVIFLMGPTASGKTQQAISLVQQFPCEVISVDSAMIYREMDIGTAKPDAAVLKEVPHRLIDILDPSEAYSVAQFCQDAHREIQSVHAQGKVPLLVGGSMLYFHALLEGLAQLPESTPEGRHQLQVFLEQHGLDEMHAWLMSIDPIAAKRIHPNDPQRIQRALEVFLSSGRTLTQWQKEAVTEPFPYPLFSIALHCERARLRERIGLRFSQMLEKGFLNEVKNLYARGDLTVDLPSIRAVGYRQAWRHLEGDYDQVTMANKAVTATCQLAKRQMTWLKRWKETVWFDGDGHDVVTQIREWVGRNVFG